MEVTFSKLIEQRCTTWEAVRGKRTRVPGTTMALGRGGLPHDLVQLIAEGTLGVARGFWGSVATGATFASTGRKRNRPGRAVIAQNREVIVETEHVVGEHYRRWLTGEATPCAPMFDFYDRKWRALGDGEGITVEWPTLAFLGTVTAPTR